MAIVGAVWALVWTVGSFEDISTDSKFGSPKLGTLDIVLGALFAAVAVIEIFGIGAAASRRIQMMRMYTLLSVVGLALVVASQILLFVLHFVFKSALINECEQLSRNASLVERIGVWGPLITEQLNPDQINSACSSLWSRDSFTAFVWIVVVAFYAISTAMFAFAYVHQLRDPTSVINTSRAPSNQQRSNAGRPYPQHYNLPYAGGADASVPDLDYGSGPYAPPTGPPPLESQGYYAESEAELGKAPAYEAGAGYGMVRDVKKGDDPFADFESSGAGRRRGSEDTLTESNMKAQAGKSSFDD